MNFLSMDYFLMTAEKRSFTKAADALHIPQQTLSTHIANLEQELDCKLFVRSNRGVKLTPEGGRLLSHVIVAHEQLQ